MQANYHTHSRWCRHGTGEFEDYFEEGIRCGLKELAMTEHVPQQPSPLRPDSWIPWEEFPAFDAALDQAIAKYEGRIHIMKGFECEYFMDSLDNYRRFQELGYSFLILGQHRCGRRQEIDVFREKGPLELHRYAEDVCKGLETGLFRLLAHPDCVLVGYRNGWDRDCEQIFSEIFQACAEWHIPVEINANGIRGHRPYPCREAFTLSKNYQLEYLISSDAHEPQFLVDGACQKAADFASELGIQVKPFL